MYKRKPVIVHNASDQNVYAKVENQTLTEKDKGVGVTVGAASLVEGGMTYSKHQKFDTSTRTGYTMVERFSTVSFYVNQSTPTAYVSVIPYNKDESGEYEHLCEGHPVQSSGDGVIITKDFYFRSSKDGWIDSQGKDHTPISKTRQSEDPSGLKYLKKKKKKSKHD